MVHMKTNQYAANLLTSTLNKYSIRKFYTNSIHILLDGSTDSAVVKKKSIYVLFTNQEAFHPTISFFSLRDLPSQDAKGIFKALKKEFAGLEQHLKAFEQREHLLKNTAFLASDKV